MTLMWNYKLKNLFSFLPCFRSGCFIPAKEIVNTKPLPCRDYKLAPPCLAPSDKYTFVHWGLQLATSCQLNDLGTDSLRVNTLLSPCLGFMWRPAQMFRAVTWSSNPVQTSGCILADLTKSKDFLEQVNSWWVCGEVSGDRIAHMQSLETRGF